MILNGQHYLATHRYGERAVREEIDRLIERRIALDLLERIAYELNYIDAIVAIRIIRSGD